MADNNPVDPAAALAASIVAALPPPPAPPSMATALATLNVKTHIPFSLELDPPNYSAWRELFLTLIGKFGVTNHIDGAPAPDPVDANWQAVDYSVRSLIYSSCSFRVMRMVMTPGASTRAVWTKAANLFLDNKPSRALALEQRFRTLVQGDLPVLEYAQRLKDLADGLADLDQPVSDGTLLLTLVRGVNEPLRHMASIIKTKEPLEESELPTSKTSATALVAPSASSEPPPTPPAAPTAPATQTTMQRPPPPNQQRHGGRGKGRGRGRGSPWQSQQRPWSHPWGGSFQMWPSASGLLGPRPGTAPFQAPQAHFAAPPTSGSSYGVFAPPQLGAPHNDPTAAWNQVALMNTFNAMTL